MSWNYSMRLGALVMLLAAGSLTGCQRREKVVDIKAPGFELEVNKTTDGPKIDVETRGK